MGLSKIELIYKIILPTLAFISSIAVPLILNWRKLFPRKKGGLTEEIEKVVEEKIKELGLVPPVPKEEFERQIKSYEAKLSQKELELITEKLEKAKLSFERGTERLEAQNYEGAIKDLEEALKILPGGSEPSLSTHFNLGIALIEFPRGDREGNLKRAIESYKKILSFHTIGKTPERYASTQNNLGTAYWGLSEVRDKESNLGRAITAYNEALGVYTKESFPWYFVETSWNLALALYKKGDLTGALRVMEGMLPVAEGEGHPYIGTFRQFYEGLKSGR